MKRKVYNSKDRCNKCRENVLVSCNRNYDISFKLNIGSFGESSLAND